ncbi:MAG: HEAT repeat domain-containing protein, partial [Thermodesulfobacteriota bacterium]
DIRIYMSLLIFTILNNSTEIINFPENYENSLAQNLKDKNTDVVSNTLRIISIIKPHPPAELQSDIIKLVNHDDISMRCSAIYTLSKFRPITNVIEDMLIKYSKERINNNSCKTFAIRGLKEIYDLENDVLEIIINSLKDEEVTARQEALTVLSELGTSAKKSLPNIRQIAINSQETELVRRHAINAMYRIGNDDQIVVETLSICIEKDEKETIRLSALAYLGEMGPNSANVIEKINKIINDKYENKFIRQKAIETMEKIKGKK